MSLAERPTALAPGGGVQIGRNEDGVRHAFCPPNRGGRRRPALSMAFGAGEIMPLVSSKHMIPGNPGSSTGLGANGIVAAGNEPMTKVLLIEDDSETAEEITAELADRGFEDEWSARGIEGLDKARSSRPDAMIVDRLFPVMD